MSKMPPNKDINVLFAHVAYEFAEPFTARGTGMTFDIARNFAELEAKIANADVLSVSMMWKNELAPKAKRLKLIQSISAGTEHACGVRKDGGLFCWGANTSGQLGDGTQSQRPSPTPATVPCP